MSTRGSRISGTTVLPFAKEQGEGAILLVDRQSGKAIAITLWKDEEALRASEEAADALRAEAANRMGASGTPAGQAYEVAVFEAQSPSRVRPGQTPVIAPATNPPRTPSRRPSGL